MLLLTSGCKARLAALCPWCLCFLLAGSRNLLLTSPLLSSPRHCHLDLSGYSYREYVVTCYIHYNVPINRLDIIPIPWACEQSTPLLHLGQGFLCLFHLSVDGVQVALHPVQLLALLVQHLKGPSPRDLGL